MPMMTYAAIFADALSRNFIYTSKTLTDGMVKSSSAIHMKNAQSTLVITICIEFINP